MSNEKNDGGVTTSDKVSPEERQKVIDLVDLVQKFLPEGENVVGINCLIASVAHDGTEDHKDCRILVRHMGGAAATDVLAKLSKASISSGVKLMQQASDEGGSEVLDALLRAPLPEDTKGN